MSVALATLWKLVEAAGIEPASASIQPSARHMLSRVISFNGPHANGQAWKTRSR